MNGTASETRALKQNLSVGDLVLFGSPHGEKTAARILKLNPKRAKVIQLEDRGGRGGVGTVWNVSYNAVMTLPSGHRLSPQLIDPKERQTPAATSGEKPEPSGAGRQEDSFCQADYSERTGCRALVREVANATSRPCRNPGRRRLALWQ